MTNQESISVASRRPTSQAERQVQQQRGGPIRVATKKFTGKTDGIQGAVFDISAGLDTKFNDTHRELYEYVACEMNNGYSAARDTKDLAVTTYNPPPFPDIVRPDPNRSKKTVGLPDREVEYLK